jgi:hypothetical protein
MIAHGVTVRRIGRLGDDLARLPSLDVVCFRLVTLAAKAA